MIETKEPKQRAVLFGTDRPENLFWGDKPLEELGRLAETAGAMVVDCIVQRRRKINPATYIGHGKAEEIKESIERNSADLAIFDDELSASQARNLEEIFEIQVLDRSELILDIFARHASTTEAKLQVELAQLEYLLPRLKRMWVHLSRIRGGIGLRGPGETQLETDHRLIKKRIITYRKKLSGIIKQHSMRRKGRRDSFNLALVGYTNAGKSSIMNGLTGTEVTIRDQLFSTLDTTTRKVPLPGGHEVFLSDTVGFISRLPHHLVASFKATLEEVCEADHLLVVVDVFSSHYHERLGVVEDVLKDIGAGGTERTYVFNKTDLVTDRHSLSEVAERYPGAVFASAIKGEAGLKHLKERIIRLVENQESEFSISLEPQEGGLIAAFHRLGNVLEKRLENGRIDLRVRIPRTLAERILAGTPYAGQLSGGGKN